MEYICPVNDLEQRLKEAGKQLAFPPPSTKDLLDLLDKTEQLLTFVGQAPTIPMQGALVPVMGALIADGLVKHSDIDVRVALASCLCEVARITAPKPPYKDEIMKDIFQLNVLAFGQLSNVTGQSYYKAIHILESVAKVKSCLLMLDLECDALVLEMFEKFLSEIRLNHPPTVFSDIEAVMTIIIEESDEISAELLSLLICHVKKEKQIATPASWKVAEKVLTNCINTLKTYFETITKLINSNPDEYPEVVTILCQNAKENGHMRARSTRTNSSHKRNLNILENGGSMKKQKYIDDRLKGKELETSRRGRPKKIKNSLNQDNSPYSVQNSKENTRKTRFQDKKQSSKMKDYIGNLGSLYNVVIKKEDEILADHDCAEPSMQQTSNNRTQNRRRPSSNKRLANGSRSKAIPEKWGQDLVGYRVKVWWPLDKMYYEGAVSSYDPADKTYKILYADGDEEVLNLHDEKWEILDQISPNQEQVAELRAPKKTPARRPKQKGKRKLEASVKQEDNSNKRKRPRLAGSSKTANVICNASDNQKNDPVSTPADSSKTMNIICNADDQKNHPVSTPAESSKTTDVICNANIQQNHPVSTPAESSKTEDVTCNGDNPKNTVILALGTSCVIKLTKKETDDMGEYGDPKLNADLQENKQSGSSEIPQNLEKMDKLVCET